MPSAEHHDRIAGGAAIGARTQPPPHAERIDDRHPRANVQQPLDKAFRSIGLARAGGADDRDAVIERVGRKTGRQTLHRRKPGIASRFDRGEMCAALARSGRRFRRHGQPPPAAGADRIFVHDSFVNL
jgi:hypothetical protein